jgi:hypothetical protein
MGDRFPIPLFPPTTRDGAATPVERATILIAELLAEQTAREIVAEERKREAKSETRP